MHTRSARERVAAETATATNRGRICTTRRRTSSTCPDYTQTITLGVPSRPWWTDSTFIPFDPRSLIARHSCCRIWAQIFNSRSSHCISLVHAIGVDLSSQHSQPTIHGNSAKRHSTEFAHVHVHHQVHPGKIVEVNQNHECELHSTGIYCSKCQAAATKDETSTALDPQLIIHPPFTGTSPFSRKCRAI